MSGMYRIAFCVSGQLSNIIARDLLGTTSQGKEIHRLLGNKFDVHYTFRRLRTDLLEMSIASVEEERCIDSRNGQVLLHLSGSLSSRSASFPFFTIDISLSVPNCITSLVEDDISKSSLIARHGAYDLLQPSRHGPADPRTSRPKWVGE